RKNKQKVSTKSRKKRPTISKVSKLRYALESPKEKDQQLETKKKEIKNQQKFTILINAACKNTIEAFSNLEEKLLELEKKSQEKEIKEIDKMTFLQEIVDEIDAEKDIPKESIELLKAELNKANTMGLSSQNTKVDNIKNKIIINKAKSNIATYYPRGTVKENKTHDLTDQELYYQDEIGLEKAYEDWKKRINRRQIDDGTNQVKKDEYEAFKSYERPTEPNKRTQVKNRLKTFSYCQEYTEMKHIDKTIEGYFKNRTSIEADIGPNSTNDLEYTCENWKKRVKILKRMTKKSKDKDQNETKKQEEHGQANLNFLYKTWMNKIEIFKRTIKYLYEPNDPESYKIADTVQDTETSRKDKAQSIQPLQNLKSRYQELKDMDHLVMCLMWKHDDGSEKMFDYLYDKMEMYSIDLSTDDLKFIKNLIK
ncbi:25835_t:CDS:2, partial [Gigaspora margarita]